MKKLFISTTVACFGLIEHCSLRFAKTSANYFRKIGCLLMSLIMVYVVSPPCFAVSSIHTYESLSKIDENLEVFKALISGSITAEQKKMLGIIVLQMEVLLCW